VKPECTPGSAATRARRAAGLRLVPGAAALTRAWFVYNKPKGPSYTHGGMLMGLGLTGARARPPRVCKKPPGRCGAGARVRPDARALLSARAGR
jgi:hypothetical protein